MTQDYKDNILNYITNNVSETSGSNTPQYPASIEVDGNVFNDLGDLLPNASMYSVLGSLYYELNQNTLFYGYYKENDIYYGFVYLVDSNMETIQLITTFTSGTKLFPLIDMHQDENNYIYALSIDLNDPQTARVLLLNNIFASLTNTYQVLLRQSYIIPNSNDYRFSPYYPGRINKIPGEATYYIICRSLASLTTIIEFVINVGEGNEWNVYTLDHRFDNIRFDTLTEKIGDEAVFYFYGVSSTTPEVFSQFEIKNRTITRIKNVELPTTSLLTSSQVFCKDKDTVYFSSLDETTAPNDYNQIYKIVDNKWELIYNELITSTSFYDWIYFKLINNIIFLQHTYGTGSNYDTDVGILQDDVVYFANTEDTINANPINISALSCVNVQYNLVMIYIPGTTKSKMLKFEYNPLNYNGLEYTNYNQTVPTKARLYSTSELMFARNLYNTTLLNSTATSSLQIPNTLLNNVSITQENLIGETNAVLVSNNTNLTKNVYETLYINFIRTLNVIDEDTDTTYPSTASYINQNIHVGTKQNCEHSFVGKVQVNYEDSSIIQNINWTYNTDHYETSFVIDATNEVPTITFISNDETTMYITKELDISTGHYYLVSQKLRIE